ncbi:MAG: hypothetical protein A4E67_01883 [Syntrophaceae bacterium PtaB.Bin038]|nr:MAG: hypothetical protein A4E67_01883 [Syntrophaceae bacterium PtaB.Bin038]
MRQRDIRKYVYDVAQACDLIPQFTKGKSLENCRSDPLLRSAVERQFEIVGEALRQAIKLQPSIAQRVTDAARIIAFRNRLIHGYAFVSDEVVWASLKPACLRSFPKFAGFSKR